MGPQALVPLQLDEGPLGLGNREYYLSPNYANILDAYHDAMIAIAMHFGKAFESLSIPQVYSKALLAGASRRNAIREMTDVLKLEIQLANVRRSCKGSCNIARVRYFQISSKLEDRREHSHLFNPMTLGEVKERFPAVC